MLVDIFSSFDDQNQVFISLYGLVWIFSLVVMLIFRRSLWVKKPRWAEVISVFKETVARQVSRSYGTNLGGFMALISGLFLFLIFINLIGLVPYVFRRTSHLAISFSLGFPLWLSLIISGVIAAPSSVVAALLPMGAPAALNPFLVLIETVSIIARPITLSVRLMANISAGHIVLTLIGNYLTTSLFFLPSVRALILLRIQVFYTIFEFGIGVIQAYIFCLLITLYSDEHPH